MAEKITKEDKIQDALLIKSIAKGMKSGKASKKAVIKFFANYGIILRNN